MAYMHDDGSPVDRARLLAELKEEDPKLYEAMKDLYETAARRQHDYKVQMRRMYDLRVEIRSWSGRPPPPLPECLKP
jgi:hypothetical protein